jgi:hypothetical protein
MSLADYDASYQQRHIRVGGGGSTHRPTVCSHSKTLIIPWPNALPRLSRRSSPRLQHLFVPLSRRRFDRVQQQRAHASRAFPQPAPSNQPRAIREPWFLYQYNRTLLHIINPMDDAVRDQQARVRSATAGSNRCLRLPHLAPELMPACDCFPDHSTSLESESKRALEGERKRQ